MKFKDITGNISGDTIIELVNYHGTRLEDILDKDNLLYEMDERYKECEVMGISTTTNEESEPILKIAISTCDIVKVTFMTSANGECFEEDKEFDRFDYDSDEEMKEDIQAELDEWIEYLVDDIRSYADIEYH